MKIRAFLRIMLILMACLIVSSCGGGSGSNSATEPLPPATSQPVPDLMITSVTWEPNSALVPPQTTVRFAIEVENRGSASASTTIVVTGPGNYSGAIIGGLQPGETKTASIDYPVVSPLATYTMSFTVDPDNVIAESNDSNNQSRQITIQTSG